MNNLITVVIVNYNTGRYLKECVTSVLADPLAQQIILVDNCSTDNSLKLVEQYLSHHSRLKIIKNSANLGFSAANNIAIRQSNSEFILFLNPDCILLPGTLRRMVQVMRDYPQAGMAGCLIKNPDMTVQSTCVRAIPTPWNSLVRVLHLNKLFPRQALFQGLDLANNHLPDKITPVEGISGAFMFVRQQALQQVGELDEHYFLYCEDVDWMMRFLQRNWQILFVPDVAIVHAKSVSSKQKPLRVLWYKHKGMRYFYHKFFRQRYSFITMSLVYAAIWVRFVLLITAQSLILGFAKMKNKFSDPNMQLRRWIRLITSFRVLGRNLKMLWDTFKKYGLIDFLLFFHLRLQRYSPRIQYAIWHLRYARVHASQRRDILRQIKKLQHTPPISLLIIDNDTSQFLNKAIESVKKQLYPHWELLIVTYAGKQISAYVDDSRIKTFHLDKPISFAASFNEALKNVTGDYLALLGGADLLSEDALFQVALTHNVSPSSDLIYSDEDFINEKGKFCQPAFKTAWNPALILATNYIHRLAVYRTQLIKELQGMRGELEGGEEYDLLLRFVNKIPESNIKHIPKILYHARHKQPEIKLEVIEKIISDYLGSKNLMADISLNQKIKNSWEVRFKLPSLPKVAIIIPTRDRVELLQVCVDALLDSARTSYPNFEVLVMDNQSCEPATHDYFAKIKQDPRVKIIPFDEAFNWSRVNNVGAQYTDAEWLLFLNNDIEPINKEWLDEMVAATAQPNVAVVGAKLYYPNDTIQHAGVVLGMGGVAGHVLVGTDRDTPEAYLQPHLFAPRNYSAVTGACLLVNKKIFHDHNGFDETLAVAYNDIDFCIRLVKQGHGIVWTPLAELYHYESATRGSDMNKKNYARFMTEVAYMQKQHGDVLNVDAYYNPNLSLAYTSLDLAFPPRI